MFAVFAICIQSLKLVCLSLTVPVSRWWHIYDVITGTLTRCIDSLEQQDNESQVMNGSVSKEGHAATSALRQILNAAYQINIQITPGNTVLRHLVDKMKQVIWWEVKFEKIEIKSLIKLYHKLRDLLWWCFTRIFFSCGYCCLTPRHKTKRVLTRIIVFCHMTRKFVEAVYYDNIPLYAIYTPYVWWLFVMKNVIKKPS